MKGLLLDFSEVSVDDIIVALALVIPVILERRQQRLAYKKGGEC